jgi:hypothetical protein
MRVLLIALMVVPLAASTLFAGTNGGVAPYLEAAGDTPAAGKEDPAARYVEFTVGATGFAAVNAVHADLEYDPAGLRFDGFVAGDLFADPVLFGPFDRADRNVVDVTTATLAGAVAPEEGVVGTFRFEVLDGERATVRLVAFQTADDEWAVETQVSRANAVALSGLPSANRLIGSMPNPFNPSTEVRFSLAERSVIRLDVYSVSGRLVRTLAEGAWAAGTHAVSWDGTGADGNEVASGVYFARFEAGRYIETKRMTLLR